MLRAGLHFDVPADEYHADPCEGPSLSSSVAKVLLDQTPLHAWAIHPRLNLACDNDRNPTRPAEIGTAAHKMLLDRGAEVVVIDAKSYQSGDARADRARAMLDGKAPILRDDHAAATRLADCAKRAMQETPGCEDFFAGKSEVVMIWEDIGGAWCRGMIDRLYIDQGRAVIFDVKTTAGGLSDRALSARIADGYDVQAAFYVRGLSQLYPKLAGRIRFVWIFIEQDDPHEVRVIEASRPTLTIGDKKAAFAIETWRRCMAAGDWPGYARKIETLEYPVWAEYQWGRREEACEDIAIASRPLDRAPAETEPDSIIFGEARIRL